MAYGWGMGNGPVWMENGEVDMDGEWGERGMKVNGEGCLQKGAIQVMSQRLNEGGRVSDQWGKLL